MLMQTFSFTRLFLFFFYFLFSLNKLLSGITLCAQPQNSLSSRFVIDYFIFMFVCLYFSKVGTASPASSSLWCLDHDLTSGPRQYRSLLAMYRSRSLIVSCSNYNYYYPVCCSCSSNNNSSSLVAN